MMDMDTIELITGVMIIIIIAKIIYDYKVKTDILKVFNRDNPNCEMHFARLDNLIERYDRNHSEFSKNKDNIYELGIKRKISLSRSIVSNVTTNHDPDKYVIKYFFGNDYKRASNYFNMLKQHNDIIETHAELKEEYDDRMSRLAVKIRLLMGDKYSKRKIRKVMCKQYPFEDIDYKLATKSDFLFHYASPGGKSKLSYDVHIINDDMRNKLDELNKSKHHSKRERNKMSAKFREEIKRRDNYTCRICGNSAHREPNLLLEVDHIIPVSKGGTSVRHNLQTLCWRCNRIKSDN